MVGNDRVAELIGSRKADQVPASRCIIDPEAQCTPARVGVSCQRLALDFALGQSTLDDFRTLCHLVAGMAGGVWLNLGSAVVMPEVFLKAVSIARNLGR